MTCPIIGLSFVVVYNHGQSLIIPTKYVTFGLTRGHNLPIECIAEVLYSMALPSRVCWFALFAYRLNKSVSIQTLFLIFRFRFRWDNYAPFSTIICTIPVTYWPTQLMTTYKLLWSGVSPGSHAERKMILSLEEIQATLIKFSPNTSVPTVFSR